MQGEATSTHDDPTDNSSLSAGAPLEQGRYVTNARCNRPPICSQFIALRTTILLGATAAELRRDIAKHIHSCTAP